jgi:hypothetical protein
VTEIVGHGVIEMTMNVYGHVNLETQRSALDDLDESIQRRATAAAHALFITVMTLVSQTGEHPAESAGLADGTQLAFLCGAGIATISAVRAYLVRRPPGRRVEAGQALAQGPVIGRGKCLFSAQGRPGQEESMVRTEVVPAVRRPAGAAAAARLVSGRPALPYDAAFTFVEVVHPVRPGIGECIEDGGVGSDGGFEAEPRDANDELLGFEPAAVAERF